MKAKDHLKNIREFKAYASARSSRELLAETFKQLGVGFKTTKPDAFSKVSLDLGNGYWFTFNSEGDYVGTYNLYIAPSEE